MMKTCMRSMRFMPAHGKAPGIKSVCAASLRSAIVSQSAGQRFTIAQWDYFPTLHLSNQIANGHQVMASYTRRIDRPGGGDLEPFQTWRDAYNVSVGNPALE